MEKRTKHYLQKSFVRKFAGKKLYSKIKFFKIYLSAVFGSNYEISKILLNVLNPDDVFFDVGANLGQYIIRIKRKFKTGVKIHAFEPVISNYNILSIFILKKYFNVKLENIAISDVDGYDVLYIPLINGIEIDTQASIDYENRKMYYNDFKKQDIKKITIDSYVVSNGIRKIDYLKIDTEGNDERVLNGAFKAISQFRPVIFCEDMGSEVTLNKLFELNYIRFLLNKEFKLIEYSDNKSDEVFNDLIIFIPNEKIFIFKKYIIDL